ncbi:MAG: phenylacetate--CoA ligase family protein [Thermoguttaceae bacterium]
MSEKYFSPEMETLSVNDLRQKQTTLFKKQLLHVYSGSAAYRERYEKSGIDRNWLENQFSGLEDVVKIPTIDKETLRQQYPLGLCCVPKSSIREIHLSSGSTGTPIVMPYTLADLQQWSECMGRCYKMAGAQTGDVVQITPSFGLFNGGFGMYHGARAAELFIVPTGAGNTERQVRLARDFGTRIFCGVVSYGIRVLEVMEETRIQLPELKIGIFGAETFSEGLKKRFRDSLGLEPFDIYGMTETGGVGTLGMDCSEHQGIHVWEDHYYVEVLQPRSLEPVPDGDIGELVITSLTRDALPVIRFRTGDLTQIVSREKCRCGRTHVRIAPTLGRTDDMLIIKGVNFFPKQVEQALMEIPGVLPHYQIIVEEWDGVKDIRVNVEAEEGVTGYMVEKHLKERLGFSPKGDVFKRGELPRQEGKAKRVFTREGEC